MANWHVDLQFPTTLRFCYTAIATVFLLLIPPANPLSFDYVGFKYNRPKLEGDAYATRSTIQITLNDRDHNSKYSVGRVRSVDQMHLWDKSTGILTDFYTKFSFVIYSNDLIYGDGLAFFLADPNLPLLHDIVEGGGLGLVDRDQILNSSESSFVAVEFDTFSNPWDPPENHVGVNFNSMRSNITELWQQAIVFNRSYDCIIKYNSTTQLLVVYFTGYENRTFERFLQQISCRVDLREYLPEWVIFGFTAATGHLFETHTLYSWSFSSNLESDGSNKGGIPPIAAPPNSYSSPANRNNTMTWVGLGIGIILVVGIFGLAYFIIWKRSKQKESDFDLAMDDEFQKGTGPKKFRYNDLVRATSNFAEAQKLGQGGFGDVYKGNLKELNCFVAIKRISRDSRQGVKEYATEVKIISQLRHRNLVQLIGWCHKKNDLLLIYEFMSNGSLDSHLHNGKFFLAWPVRYNIALGLASALLYLQEEGEQCVLHRDIKSSNIMLDSCFIAKLSDFGLARMVDHEKALQTTHIVGTKGYMAPEYVTSGKANKESDLYSFGVVLLEIASGRKPVDLQAKEEHIVIVEWAWELYGSGKLLEVADSKLRGVFDEQQMECLVIVGLWCAHPLCSSRPSIREVIHVLNFEACLPTLPKKFPVLTYLPPKIDSVFSSVSSSCNSTSETT